MQELRNCPFCGEPAQYRVFGYRNDLLMIECANKFGACVSMSTVNTEESKQILTEKWNCRSADREIATLTVALIDQIKEI